VASYGFEEGSGSTVYDASSGGNPGTIRGATRVTGKQGKGLSFDGNDYVTVADSGTLRLSAGMSLEAWVKPSAKSTAARYALAKMRPGGGYDYALAASDTGPATGTVRTVSQYSTPAGSLTAGRWSHLAATYDGTNLRVYVDGVLASSRSVSGAITASGGALRIGTSFKGVIDDVRIYNGARSAPEIQADSGGGTLAQLTALRSAATAKATHRRQKKATKRHKQATRRR
jgi:hypothetical protein